MRRGVGVGKALAAKRTKEAFAEKGAALTEARLEDMQGQLTQFKASLEAFASKHATKINEDPEFRSKFAAMCAKVGVDPLSSSKGFWAEVLGVGAFFYELAVQTLHVCIATREANGGIMQLGDLVRYLQKIRARSAARVKSVKGAQAAQQEVTEDDVKRAVATLEPLGNGVRLVQVGARKMLVSVPLELSQDHASVLELAQARGGAVSVAALREQLRWEDSRSERTLGALQSQGMAWVDQHDAETTFWFPSIALQLL